ncbi:MAG: hypothetical protein J6O41_01120 [Clostridia bacterium]|nr:hypothetical protein [Clostridia bacterium]
MGKLIQMKDNDGKVFPKIYDVYSHNEVKTNKVYIDENGKEWVIYRNIITGTLPTTNFTTFITINNLNEILLEDIRVTLTDGNKIKLPFVNLINNVYCDYYISGNKYMTHFSASTYGNRPFKAILEYTKN